MSVVVLLDEEGREHDDKRQKCAGCFGDMAAGDSDGLNCGDES